MPLHNFVATEVLTAANLNAVAKQAVITCTAATRPGTPNAGMVIYQTDTDQFWYYTGTAWSVFPGTQLGMAQSNGTTSFTTTETKDSTGDLTFTSAGASVVYEVSFFGQMDTTVANDAVDVKIRDGGGSSPINTSPIVTATRVQVAGTGATFSVPVWISQRVTFTAGTHVIAAFGVRFSGSGTEALFPVAGTKDLVVSRV